MTIRARGCAENGHRALHAVGVHRGESCMLLVDKVRDLRRAEYVFHGRSASGSEYHCAVMAVLGRVVTSDTGRGAGQPRPGHEGGGMRIPGVCGKEGRSYSSVHEPVEEAAAGRLGNDLPRLQKLLLDRVTRDLARMPPTGTAIVDDPVHNRPETSPAQDRSGSWWPRPFTCAVR